jgi:hypothetical protein
MRRMAEAYRHDDVAVVEEGVVDARELEVGVLGHERSRSPGPGEIVPAGDFYDFDAKYLAASDLVIPADVDEDVRPRHGRELAVRAFRAIGCRGLARVDFFLTADGEVLVNEINTIPGFTATSMFPRLWAAEGLLPGAGRPAAARRALTHAEAETVRRPATAMPPSGGAGVGQALTGGRCTLPALMHEVHTSRRTVRPST